MFQNLLQSVDGGRFAAWLFRVAVGVTAIWTIALGASLALRSASAALRHRIWALSIIAVLVLPTAIALLPEHRVGRTIVPPSPTAPAAFEAPVEVDAPADQPPIGFVAASSAVPAPYRINWPLIAWITWAVPAGVLIARCAISFAVVSRLVRSAVDTGLTMTAIPVQNAIRISTPLCVGILHPTILLPSTWRHWSDEQLTSVLDHELAHVARRDVLWQTLARLACAIYWVHPLGWFAAWRMRVERELACDDAVLRRGQSPMNYARWLLEIAEAARPGRFAACVSMALQSGIEGRIRCVLDPNRRRSTPARGTKVVSAIAAVLLLLGCATVSPLSRHESPAAEAPPAYKLPRKISGVVLTPTSQPAAHATLKLHTSTYTVDAQTDARGRFELNADAAIPWMSLLATADGGEKQTLHVIDFRQGAAPQNDLQLVLKPARALGVIVKNGAGQPVRAASVAVTAATMMQVAAQATDSNGRATLRVPADADLAFLVAEKDGVGLDYRTFRNRTESAGASAYTISPDAAESVEMTLAGAREVTVKTVDSEGKPLAEVSVYPYGFDLPHHGEQVWMFGIEHDRKLTTAAGTAVFRAIPAKAAPRLEFELHKEGYTPAERVILTAPAATTQATLLRQVIVTGEVTDETGKPRNGVKVHASGDGYTGKRFDNFAVTDAAGKFSLSVDPMKYYLFVADDVESHLASAPQTKVILDQGPPPLHFQLSGATQLTINVDPFFAQGGKVIQLNLQSDDRDRHAAEDQLYNRQGSSRALNPFITQWTQPAADGSFRFSAGLGKYEFNFADTGRRRAWTVDVKHEPVLDIHIVPPESASARQIKGHLVTPSGEKVRADMEIQGYTTAFGFFKATTDTGDFTANCPAGEARIRVRNSDRSLIGVATVPENGNEATITVTPVSSATGRLIDTDGKPVVGQRISYGVHAPAGHGRWQYIFGERDTTTADGSFILEGLAPGLEYSYTTMLEGPKGTQRVLTLGTITPKAPGEIKLGDVTFKPPPQKPTTRPR